MRGHVFQWYKKGIFMAGCSLLLLTFTERECVMLRLLRELRFSSVKLQYIVL
jgi:hypothetical protein